MGIRARTLVQRRFLKSKGESIARSNSLRTLKKNRTAIWIDKGLKVVLGNLRLK
ncbi:MAG: hypothetical protein ACJAXE_001559 [Neolewinella sp.]|jgi:hypothetical protein